MTEYTELLDYVRRIVACGGRGIDVHIAIALLHSTPERPLRLKDIELIVERSDRTDLVSAAIRRLKAWGFIDCHRDPAAIGRLRTKVWYRSFAMGPE